MVEAQQPAAMATEDRRALKSEGKSLEFGFRSSSPPISFSQMRKQSSVAYKESLQLCIWRKYNFADGCRRISVCPLEKIEKDGSVKGDGWSPADDDERNGLGHSKSTLSTGSMKFILSQLPDYTKRDSSQSACMLVEKGFHHFQSSKNSKRNLLHFLFWIWILGEDAIVTDAMLCRDMLGLLEPKCDFGIRYVKSCSIFVAQLSNYSSTQAHHGPRVQQAQHVHQPAPLPRIELRSAARAAAHRDEPVAHGAANRRDLRAH